MQPLLGTTLDSRTWARIAEKAALFGIRTGIFDCEQDSQLCEAKQWTSSRLLLALPPDDLLVRKDLDVLQPVILHQYVVNASSQISNIFTWIHEQFAHRVKQIKTLEEVTEALSKNVSNSSSSSSSFLSSGTLNNVGLELVFISSLATTPLIISALAMKFKGVKIATFRAEKGSKLGSFLKRRAMPVCAITLSDQSIYLYGNKPGETYNYRNMELLLRTLNPEMNDVFLLTLLLVNIVASLNFFWMKCSRFWKHLVYWFMYFVKYNCVLFLCWLTILALSGFPAMEQLTAIGLRLCQYFSTSSFAVIMRHDALHHYKLPMLTVAFLFCGCCLAAFRRLVCLSSPDDNDDEFLFRDWAPWESTILSYFLFRPMGMSALRPVSASIEANLEEGMELLIERLATPNLWLQPELISNDYIKSLPLWHYIDSNEYEDTSSSSSSACSSGEEIYSECSSDLLEQRPSTSNSSPSPSSSQQLTVASSASSSSPSSWMQTNLELTTAAEQQCNVQKKSSSPRCHKRTSHKESHANRSPGKMELGKNQNKHQRHRDVSPEATAPNGMLLCKECAICLDGYRRGNLLCGLPCGHNYHESCIMAWLYRDNHCCPKCRWPTYKQKAKLL